MSHEKKLSTKIHVIKQKKQWKQLNHARKERIEYSYTVARNKSILTLRNKNSSV